MNFKEYLIAIKNKILKIKRDKIKEFDNDNKSINKTVNETIQQLTVKSEKEIDELLENEIKDFFPSHGSWSNLCFTKSNDLNMEYLPCHLRDNNWLAKMLQKQKKLQHISLNKILDFINNSQTFADLRHNYELKIVKWQINWIDHNGDNWITDESLGGECYLFMPNCDIAFRKAVSDTLTAIGMNKDVIEEGLEKYSDIWRKKYMLKAFNNKYYNTLDITLYDIEEPAQIHKNIWLKAREYEYYCDHKNSIDLYGQITNNMKLSPEEIRKLKLYLYKKDIERLYYIKECKKNSSQKQKISYFSEDIPFQITKSIR